MPTDPVATAATMPHSEYHALLLDVHSGERGLLVHTYRPCMFSGAGNCCCGRARESTLHPHPFTLSRWGKERGRWLCVCSKSPDHAAHQEVQP